VLQPPAQEFYAHCQLEERSAGGLAVQRYFLLQGYGQWPLQWHSYAAQGKSSEDLEESSTRRYTQHRSQMPFLQMSATSRVQFALFFVLKGFRRYHNGRGLQANHQEVFHPLHFASLCSSKGNHHVFELSSAAIVLCGSPGWPENPQAAPIPDMQGRPMRLGGWCCPHCEVVILSYT